MNGIDPQLAERVVDFARDKLGRENVSEPRFDLLSGGNSHITWRMSSGGADGDLVVKVAQADGPLAPYDVAHESTMMDRAFRMGVPAPELVGFVQDGDLQFIVMRHVAGDSPSLWEVAKWLADKPASERIAIGRDLVSIVPMLGQAASDVREPLSTLSAAYLDKLVQDLETSTTGVMDLPRSIRAVHGWLTERLAALDEAAPSLHHGDFRLGNAVFRDGRIVAMLDWERAMIGHPLHDLGFLCLPGMRMNDRICGVLSEEELADVWQDLTQSPLDRRLVAYFRIMSMFSELCMMTRAMARIGTGAGRFVAARSLPLIARLHEALIGSIRSWNNGDFAL